MDAHPHRRHGRHIMTRRVIAVGACAAAAATLGVGTVSANPVASTRTAHATFRFVDMPDGLRPFVNTSRADSCTPEHPAFAYSRPGSVYRSQVPAGARVGAWVG